MCCQRRPKGWRRCRGCSSVIGGWGLGGLAAMAEPRCEGQPGCGTRSTDSSPGLSGTSPPAESAPPAAPPARAAPPGPGTSPPPRAAPPVTPPSLASAPVQGKSSPARVAPPTPSETMPPMPAEETPMLPLDDVRYQIACTNWY